MAQDWIIFKLSPEAEARTEFNESVVVPLDKKEIAEAEKIAKASAKQKAAVSVSDTGVRLTQAGVPEVSKLAEALEAKLGAVGIAEVRTNEWWDRADFEETRAPIG